MKPLIIATGDLSKKNVALVLGLYDLMITQRKAKNAAQEYLASEYIQHNPTLPTGAIALGEAFTEFAATHPKLRVEVHRIIAAGNYVWAHVHFINIFSNEANDRGIAGVDIYRFDDNGKMAEHWDVLQAVPDPDTSANTNGMF
jgi:predicted SnoaL-like aldol condensation-catalyzing enzyme